MLRLILQIFSRRVKYVAETKSFDIDPRLQPPRNVRNEILMEGRVGISGSVLCPAAVCR